jgi:hypothetical protein
MRRSGTGLTSAKDARLRCLGCQQIKDDGEREEGGKKERIKRGSQHL